MGLGNVTGWAKEGNELIIKTDRGVVGLSLVEDDILRLRFNRGDTVREEETFVVERIPPLKEIALVESHRELILRTPSIEVDVGLNPLAVRVYKRDGRKILATPAPGMGEFEGDRIIARFVLEPDERIYGLGQDPMANLNHRDKERRMWHEWGGRRRSGNAGIPFLTSSRGYGILLNSSWPSRFAIGRAEVAEPGPEFSRSWAPTPWPWDVSSGETHPDRLAILLDGEIMDLFIICRDTFDEIQRGYVDLTGHAPMPPKWALGFIQCKNRYRSQEELLYIAREYRRKRIPCDVLVIDWLWFKEFGDLEWDKEHWPDPRGMLKELADMGFHVMQAQHPYIDKQSLKYELFKEKGYLNRVPEGSRPTFDHSNPEARKAWWEQIRRLYQDGIRGYWTDMGELESHPAGTTSHLGPRERVHNIYSTLWTKGLYEGQRGDFKERVFSLPRTAYAGIQRNGTALWSGDIDASWDVLRDQVAIGQGVCLSGQQYWTTDIGGFFTDERFSPELYVRWFQWGTFCPIFRTHGTRPDNEAWAFGEQAEKIIAEFINLRYRLMPYIYSCARKVTEGGTPIMRAMCVDFPDDPVAVEQDTQFMFGPAILVAPILEKGARSRRVYLPDEIWYDFWTGERISGKRWIDVPAPLSRIPLFVRAGSIIPMGPEMQYVGEKPLDKVEIHAYAGKAGFFELYEDDGLTYDYENGEYVKTLLTVDRDGNVRVEEPEGRGRLIPDNREYEIIVHSGEKIREEKESPVIVEIDSDLEGSGVCTIHAVVRNNRSQEVEIKATLRVPEGWRLKKSSPVVERRIKEYAHLQWDTMPVADVLPLIHEGNIELEIKCGEEVSHISREIHWGSGYATRWRLIGDFDNSDRKGLDRVLPVEKDPDLPYYREGGRLLWWGRELGKEFNCFGYVDFPRPPLEKLKAGQGVAYAKCSIWSPADMQGYLEISADPTIKIWINGELVHQTHSILLPRILDEPVSLRRGWNDVLVKVAMSSEKPFSGREYGFKFRIVDSQGKVVKELLYRP
ncbi:MAG: TIM-barrel domain-containing protein [bacterium]